MKRKRVTKDQGRPSPKSPFGESWTAKCQSAFQDLISKLTSAPVLAYVDQSQPFVLHTDASTMGLGAALYQRQDGHLRPVAYASRGLSTSERNYPAHKLEFLALKWVVTEKFSDYLYGSHFTVLTDNNPLTYVLTTAKLDATGHRWLANLANYDFDINYRPGKTNIDADCLSRRPHQPPEDDDEALHTQQQIRDMFARLNEPEAQTLSNNVVVAICRAHRASPTVQCNAHQKTKKSKLPTRNMYDDDISLLECISDSVDAIPSEFKIQTFTKYLSGKG